VPTVFGNFVSISFSLLQIDFNVSKWSASCKHGVIGTNLSTYFGFSTIKCQNQTLNYRLNYFQMYLAYLCILASIRVCSCVTLNTNMWFAKMWTNSYHPQWTSWLIDHNYNTSILDIEGGYSMIIQKCTFRFNSI
jgi:hypothetical protein